MLDLKTLNYFVTIVDQGSFTAAARTLHIAQPAISMAIKKLEHALDLNLFHRQDRSISLTDEGHVLLRHARQILAASAEAELEMQELKGLSKGAVRIAIPSMLGSYYFPPILMAFRHQYPNLQLQVVESGTQKIAQMLNAGEVDLGVIVSNNPPADLETLTFLQEQMMVTLPVQHPLAAKASVSYQEFFAEDLVVFKEGYFHREQLNRISQASGYPLKIGFEANLIPLIKQVVRHGFGITTLLKMVTDEDQDLVALPFTEPVWLTLSLAWRREGYLSKANCAFRDFLGEHAAKTSKS